MRESSGRRFSLYSAFVLSGAAGLAYEALWSRYLGLFVGHSAYAQVLVLTVYLGGMAVGALAVGDVSKRLASPLRWYVAAELALALFGVIFHPLFSWVTGQAYASIFPALPNAGAVGAVRWGLAGLLILPQAVILGTTFPLMAAGVVRGDAAHPGRGVATVYLANSLGAAAGVLITGFWLIGALGLPWTSVAAAGMNTAAAALAFLALRGLPPVAAPDVESTVSPRGAGGTASEPVPPWAADPRALSTLLLAVSFGTALASFAYEIGWIRMLSLVLGSATHAFELMLSAFILGLALGAWLVRGWADSSPQPLRLLGGIQVMMGLAALATIPLYIGSFDVMSILVRELPGREAGWATFNVARYALCLAIMLPSTIMAGMTLPVITGALLRGGTGERMIGRVYGLNTLGSVVGAMLAGLVALPLLGLRGLLATGAALDILLGIVLLHRSARLQDHRPTLAVGSAMVGAAATLTVLVFAHPDQAVITSGVFRSGELPDADSREVLFYQDGRTATVSAHLGLDDGLVVLSTNGKPDASLGPRWFLDDRDTFNPEPIPAGRDFTTQLVAPLVTLAHAPGARSVANIGHGSGMSGVAMLTSPRLERLVTIEIEPRMVEGSFAFLPNNAPVFNDPRSTFVFDDAKSYFAARPERFDIIFAEPSNPWVSGVANLFTEEFYGRIGDYLTAGGVLGQWVQIYELTDDLFLSVLAALDTAFPHYRGYLVGDADVAIVASLAPLPDPDWSVFTSPAALTTMRGAPPFRPPHLEALLLFDESTFRAVLDEGVVANSDFRPILDLGAERARFLGAAADGLFSFAANRLDLRRALSGERQGPLPHELVPARGLEPAVTWGRAAWLRSALEEGGAIAPAAYPEWSTDLVQLRDFLVGLQTGLPPLSWPLWAADFDEVERELHWGTAGWVHQGFYQAVEDYLGRVDPPAEVRAAVDLAHGVAAWDWPVVAEAADALVGPVGLGQHWVRPTVLLDAAVTAYLHQDRPASARRAYTVLAAESQRRSGNLRNRLLDALIRGAEEG